MGEIKCRGYASSIPVYCAHDAIVPVEELVPNPKNPNRHPGDQIELLSKVIAAQGWRQPVKVSTRSGMIVSGHGRYEAARLLECPVPVDFQDYPGEAEELQDLLADNRIAELAEMDQQALADIFSEIETVELSGYDSGAVDDILAAVAVDLDEEEIPGAVPFSEVLREEHNYIVLYFDNEVDWLQAESLFELQTVKSLSTRLDGKVPENMERRGVGRVINGAEALEVLRCAYQCELSEL